MTTSNHPHPTSHIPHPFEINEIVFHRIISFFKKHHLQLQLHWLEVVRHLISSPVHKIILIKQRQRLASDLKSIKKLNCQCQFQFQFHLIVIISLFHPSLRASTHQSICKLMHANASKRGEKGN